ncbi:uncharacterized protein BDR25DRAFT_352161 [Lindgomyces ingoldianus]|uniref:Uncharacterized protein n=1 Tax=Lindgomyces ingoldianus TaxID=673940 RepID=A0ACB6R3N1_9PLEO|nr:uncharacterized protein BDR25DRAFT_352161 [Lindgomyces ingoldianus]KAF2473672.1 hypothetical protein BDR25DRAFT_352161 [Lindgomyces ingoldianus]
MLEEDEAEVTGFNGPWKRGQRKSSSGSKEMEGFRRSCEAFTNVVSAGKGTGDRLDYADCIESREEFLPRVISRVGLYCCSLSRRLRLDKGEDGLAALHCPLLIVRSSLNGGTSVPKTFCTKRKLSGAGSPTISCFVKAVLLCTSDGGRSHQSCLRFRTRNTSPTRRLPLQSNKEQSISTRVVQQINSQSRHVPGTALLTRARTPVALPLPKTCGRRIQTSDATDRLKALATNDVQSPQQTLWSDSESPRTTRRSHRYWKFELFATYISWDAQRGQQSVVRNVTTVYEWKVTLRTHLSNRTGSQRSSWASEAAGLRMVLKIEKRYLFAAVTHGPHDSHMLPRLNPFLAYIDLEVHSLRNKLSSPSLRLSKASLKASRYHTSGMGDSRLQKSRMSLRTADTLVFIAVYHATLLSLKWSGDTFIPVIAQAIIGTTNRYFNPDEVLGKLLRDILMIYPIKFSKYHYQDLAVFLIPTTPKQIPTTRQIHDLSIATFQTPRRTNTMQIYEVYMCSCTAPPGVASHPSFRDASEGYGKNTAVLVMLLVILFIVKRDRTKLWRPLASNNMHSMLLQEKEYIVALSIKNLVTLLLSGHITTTFAIMDPARPLLNQANFLLTPTEFATLQPDGQSGSAALPTSVIEVFICVQ